MKAETLSSSPEADQLSEVLKNTSVAIMKSLLWCCLSRSPWAVPCPQLCRGGDETLDAFLEADLPKVPQVTSILMVPCRAVNRAGLNHICAGLYPFLAASMQESRLERP
ncbi:hypothetical protein M9H77_08586 [Catharanthus roseus]|uniref:Uncharacterized protein n=1 Tax=Catharanthus roseus TaxID=4058 RepID=A0ACC0BYK3_CATRO|nr:hypothetical protein M9H77_08586 [Catharanthus roseus]